MINRVRNAILISIVVAFFGVFTFQLVASPSVFADTSSGVEELQGIQDSKACTDSRFLGIPAWHNGLTKDDGSGGCVIKSPDEVGGLSAFIWKIAFNIIEIALQLVAYLAFIFILYGGFQYLTSSGNPEQAAKGRSTIFNAIIGVIIASGSAVIVSELSKLTDPDVTKTSGLLLAEILKLAYRLAGIIAIVVIILAGYAFTSGGDNPKAIEGARNRILYAVIGLVIIGLAWLLTDFILGKV